MVPETGGKMWRYLFPAVLMMSAVLVLFAGALGDLGSWPSLQDLGSWPSLQSVLVPFEEKPVDHPSLPKPTPPPGAALRANPPEPTSPAAPADTAPPQNDDALQQSPAPCRRRWMVCKKM